MLPQIIDEHANFVLNYAKKEGLNSLVSRLEMDTNNIKVKADLQPDLIHAFSSKFPNVNLSALDNTIEWILIISVAKMKEKISSESNINVMMNDDNNEYNKEN